MKICRRSGAGLKVFAIAVALSLAVLATQAKAATIALGSLSSASGSVDLNLHAGFPVLNLLIPGQTNRYSFTLTDNANVSGNITFQAFAPVIEFSVDIDLNAGASNLVHTVASSTHLDLSTISFVPASPGLFSLDLAPGNYVLSLTGGLGIYSGKLAFTSAMTPIPAALPLLMTALGGLGFVGWRRKRQAA
jgi:hypothetical protein